MNTVSLKNISHFYGKVRALDDVSLDIPSGVTVGLIGPDGVGKSTLLSLIAGVRIIQSGEVQVLGGDMRLAATRQALSHRIAYMPQGLGRNLYPTLTVYENIEFHARLFGLNAQERQQRIARLLDATSLSPFTDRAAGKLSGGMKQKLSLCCALVHNPDLLILDEPTTGVDPLSRRQFWQLVNDLRREIPNMTVLVATAYIDEAEQFERLLAMDAGKLLVNAPTKSVMADLQASTLEEAYIKLLPPEKQQGAGNVVISPFQALPDAPLAMKAENLCKRFGDFVAVDNVSFEIAQGEIFGFLGSNGCGKSTTMKMLTGLLDATSGKAQLLGEPIDAGSLKTKKRVGYMSQAFSLYEELTVRQNLALHARLYDIEHQQQAVANGLREFDLLDVADVRPSDLPLGIRQRLQLAAACLHSPEVLILDEPTSGVDPAARDMFWRKLLQLSRENRITIFVSTHFMNEVERCDRISLMHKGRVLAVGTPAELLAQSGQPTTEEAFIHYLKMDEQNISGSLKTEKAANTPISTQLAPPVGFSRYKNGLPEKNAPQFSGSQTAPSRMPHQHFGYFLAMIWAFAIREMRELLRDKIRLFFAALGPAILLASVGWAISFDVSNLRFAVLDRDQSAESRRLVEHFAGSAYFIQQPELHSDADAQRALRSNHATLILDIPPDFGRQLSMGQQPEIAFHIDGTTPFNAENVKFYAQAIVGEYSLDVLRQKGFRLPESPQIVPRFLYNQDFKSIHAMVPNVMMLVLMMIPAIMSALAVVREREMGSIQNLYASPASVWQYLLGKQLPYIGMGMFNCVLLVAMAVFWFGVPLKGSLWAIMLGGTLLVCASTALGLLISSFTQSQTAAFFVSALGSMVPTVNFSGLMYPVATLSGGAYLMGVGFPASYFGTINKGGFTKGLGVGHFYVEYAMLLLFYAVYFVLACALLKKQEK